MVLPEFLPKHWWQHILHNQTALLIKGALLVVRDYDELARDGTLTGKVWAKSRLCSSAKIGLDTPQDVINTPRTSFHRPAQL